jgi:hypothetical protein
MMFTIGLAMVVLGGLLQYEAFKRWPFIDLFTEQLIIFLEGIGLLCILTSLGIFGWNNLP